MVHGQSEDEDLLPQVSENPESLGGDLCYLRSDIGAWDMARNSDQSGIVRLAEEVKRASQTPGQAERLNLLLMRCHRVLSQWVDHMPSSSDRDEELESIARMLEAEPVIWPEDVERMNSLAARVRQRKARH